MSSFAIAPDLLRWYDRHRRTLPWRAEPGEAPDPYHVWLSEIMLQQTTVAAVIPYYERFVSRFPTVRALAEAPSEDVMGAWAGLGYYARARNLHACARAVAAAGDFPRDLAGLRALPGIGAYTAAAVGAIAFGLPAVPVDGNVERVTARLFAIQQPLPAARPALHAAAATLNDDPAARARPGDFAQALFDLGAGICTPAAPACILCPLPDRCRARALGLQDALPRKSPKPPRPLRHGVHFWLTDGQGMVLLRTRPARGLLGGMAELPGTPWRAEPWSTGEALAHAPARATWHAAGQVRHGFTHFELAIDLLAAQVPRLPVQGPGGEEPGGKGPGGEEAARQGFAHPLAALDQAALPAVMRKCARLAGRR